MLGSGAVARECFLPSFAQMGVLDKLTVVDTAVSGKLRSSWPGVKFVESDFRTAACDVSAAVVTLPNSLHEEAVLRLLDAGVHVLCEKPLALSEESCRKMRDASARNGRVLAVNMVRRLFPSIAAIARMIRNGELGEISRITLEHGGPYRWPARSFAPFQREGGGVFADMGVHYLDMAEFFAGPLELKSYRDDWRGGVEAEATAELESEGGAEVRITVSRLRTLANTITVDGTRGRIVVNVDSLATFHLFRGAGDEALEIRPAGSAAVTFQQCFERQLRRFSELIASGRTCMEDADAAIRGARTIEQAYRSRYAQSLIAHNAPSGCALAAARSQGRALVTGATGFIGARLIERLFDNGASDVTAIVRRPQTCASIARFPLKLADVDLLDENAVRTAIAGQRHVFHLAYGRDGANAKAVTMQGTQNVVNAAIEAKCESVVVLSTINVIGWPDGDTDESAPYRPAGGEYGRSKAAMEQWCLKRAAESGGTRIVVLLPSCVYGPGGKTFTELPAQLAGRNEFGWISQGKGSANYVFIDNLIDAIFLAAEAAEAHGRRFIINDGATSWRTFLEPIVAPWKDAIRSYEPGELTRVYQQSRRGALKRALKAASASPEFRREIKQTQIWTIARPLVSRTAKTQPATALNGTSAKSASNASFPPDWIENLFGNHRTRFSSAQAQAVLGWTSRISLEEGQRISVEYLSSTGRRPAVSE